jgi:hypothetical protein
LAKVEKRCAAVRALAAARAAECRAHKERGFADATSWLAHATGTSAGQARTELAAAAGLDGCPQTREALLAGEVSLAQASEITKTEAAVPGSEADLLDLAGRSGLTGLRDEGRRRRLEAQDPDERHRRQRRQRYLKHWRDDDGMIRLSGSFAPEVGVALTNRIDREVDRLARAARRADADGDVEPPERLAADALARLVLEGIAARRGVDLVLVCDAEAFRRGHAHTGEVCHVIGGGPVPVSVVQDLAGEAFIKAVLHDGVAIGTVVHYGRHIKAEIRTALGLGHPPLFEGVVCVDDGCDRRHYLQWDHVNPVANRGPTSYDNLVPRCGPHHRAKTQRDREAGLLGPFFDDDPCEPDDPYEPDESEELSDPHRPDPPGEPDRDVEAGDPQPPKLSRQPAGCPGPVSA